MKHRISEIVPRCVLEKEPKRYQVAKPMYGHFDGTVDERRRTNRSPLVIEPGKGHINGGHLERVDFFLETELIEIPGEDGCSRQGRKIITAKDRDYRTYVLTRQNSQSLHIPSQGVRPGFLYIFPRLTTQERRLRYGTSCHPPTARAIERRKNRGRRIKPTRAIAKPTPRELFFRFCLQHRLEVGFCDRWRLSKLGLSAPQTPVLARVGPSSSLGKKVRRSFGARSLTLLSPKARHLRMFLLVGKRQPQE